MQGTTNGPVAVGEALEDIIRVNTEFEEPYMVTILISDKTQARAWIKANIDSGITNGGFYEYPSGRFSGIFSPISLINTSSAPGGLAYVSGTNLASGEMLAIDDRVAIVLYRQIRGSVNERERIARRQVEARYLTERYGFVIEDDNPIRLFT